VTALEDELRWIAEQLARFDCPFAVVGGLAVSARAEPRLTRDVDMAVVVANDDEAEALSRRLMGEGCVVLALVEQEATGRLSTARFGRTGSSDVIIGLLFASSGIEAEVVSGAEPIAVVMGLTLPVASVGHLIALKLLARDDRGRPADADDLRALIEVADEDDWEVAETAVALINIRGYDRDRYLRTALAELRTHGPY
jgi:predicted nucleotidyltransferase